MVYFGEQCSVEISIVEDMKQWAYDILTNAGFNNVSLEQALHQYCNMKLRLLAPKPRQVLVSKELTCPDKCKDGYAYFKRAVEEGRQLLPFMSKMILDADSRIDKMVFDWGFFHFHLNTAPDKKDPRFIERADDLLIAYVDAYHDDKMYFLQIRPHIKSIWTEQELVRILADNWPETMERYRVKGAAALTENVRDNDYRIARDNNICTFVDLHDGRVFIGPNLGLNSAGTSARASVNYNHICNNAVLFEKTMGDAVDDIVRLINKKLDVPASIVKLRLVEPGDKDYLFKVEPYGFLLRFIITEDRTFMAVGDNANEIEEAIRQRNAV